MPNSVRFGSYEADLDSGQLRKDGTRLKLRDQCFQVLASLLEDPGRVVTREELHRRLWHDQVFVDFDNNLNILIARLREALGDSAEHPRFIETLPKRGYRFVAKVFEPPPIAQSETAHQARLVVLPFVNLSGDLAQEYLSDAITDEIITDLAAAAPQQLAVIARTTAMHYKGTRKDVAQVSRELGVDYVAEGAVHRRHNRVGITVQLIRGRDQVHIWARRYDADLSEIFDTEAAIVEAVAGQIGIAPNDRRANVSIAPRRRTPAKPTEDPAAYNEYIQGRHDLGSVSPESLAMARKHFEAAIARDSTFALAYDSLAEVYWWIGYLGFMRPIDAFSTGVLHAVRALEIDSSLAETHALLAQYHKQLRYDWPEVAREMARALALNPNSPLVRLRYAWNQLMPQGRLEDAAAELESVLDLDPFNVYCRTTLALTLLFARRFDQALIEARCLLDLDPKAYWGHYAIAVYHRECGQFKEAIASCRRAFELSGNAPAVLGWLGLILAICGEQAEARALLQKLQQMAPKTYLPATGFAWIHLGLGEIDEAFDWLDRAVEERDQYLMPIKSYAFLDPIRKDPRFAALLRKMNLQP